jgi:hypothetical protein
MVRPSAINPIIGTDLSLGVMILVHSEHLRRGNNLVEQPSQRVNSVELIGAQNKNPQASRPRVNKALQASISDITLATLTAG